MTRPDIDAILSRLKGNDCLRPELCESLYCQDWRALTAYIRSLEAREDDWEILEDRDCWRDSAARYQDLLEESQRFNAELIQQLSKLRRELAGEI